MSIGTWTFNNTGYTTISVWPEEGAVTAGNGLQIAALSTQTDVIKTWGDGSVRHAMVSANVTSTGAKAVASGTLMNATALAPTWPSASVTFVTSSGTYVATLPAAVFTDRYLGLHGSICSEGRVHVVPSKAGPTAHPFLDVFFDVRSYAGGGHRVDIMVLNCRDVALADKVTYDLTIVVAGVTVKTKLAHLHNNESAWRETYWTGQTEVTFTPDVAHAQLSLALPTYDPTWTVDVTTRSIASGFDIGEFGDLQFKMGVEGNHAELGPFPSFAGQYLCYKRSSQRDYLLKSADRAASYSGILRKSDGVSDYIDQDIFWIDGRATTGFGPACAREFIGGSPTLAGTVRYNVDGSQHDGGAIEASHMPNIWSTPYVLTGDRWYLDMAKLWVVNGIYTTYPGDPVYTGNGGTLDRNDGVLIGQAQIRGVAHPFAVAAEMIAQLPDADANRSAWEAWMQRNLDWFDTDANTENGGPLRVPLTQRIQRGFNSSGAGQGAHIGLYQANFMLSAVERAAELGLSPTDAFRERLTTFLMLFWNSSPDYTRADACEFFVKVGNVYNGVTSFLATMLDVYQVNFTTLQDSTAYVATLGRSVVNGIATSQPVFGYYGVDMRLALKARIRDNGADVAARIADLAWLEAQIVGDLDTSVRGGYALDDFPDLPGDTASAPLIIDEPADITISSGATATLGPISASGTAPKTAQWYAGSSGDTGAPIGGATSLSYTTPALTADHTYWCRISNGTGHDDSRTATVTIGSALPRTDPFSGTSPGSNWITTAGSITVGSGTAKGATGSTSNMMRWIGNVFGNNQQISAVAGDPVVGINEGLTLQDNGSRAYVWVNGPDNSGIYLYPSFAKVVTVPATLPTVASGHTRKFSIISDLLSCFDNDVAICAPAQGSNYTGGTPGIWFYGQNTAEFTTITVDNAGQASQGGGQAPLIATQPQSSTITSGATVTLTVSVQAGDDPTSWQWYEGATGVTFTPVVGETAASFTTGALTSSKQYWVRLSNAFGSADSDTATITVVTSPVITVDPVSATITAGETASFSVTATGSGPLTYQWYNGASGNTTSAIGGATSASYTTAALSVGTSLWCRVTNGSGHDDSTTAVITVNAAPDTPSSLSMTMTLTGPAVAVVEVTGDNTKYVDQLLDELVHIVPRFAPDATAISRQRLTRVDS